MKNFSKDLAHYIPLFGLLAAGFVAFWLFSYDRVFQIATAIATALAYVLWGVVHHYIHRDLNISVVVEYLVIASLGLVVIFSLVLRS
ncbi:hypothetical protein A2210_00195 [Candidatus Woesebacteria bacterium RIFOXYA1_FULL_40_18]|uniref:Uncharacterized protein n=2 Tax=Candidatus Woeseibacteriota TaxID=1752722 RepID=A0A1F8CJK5_9BACT|nr:MAG: hypothetical protein A2210_00195 [Candidatus Woesebacteria bacterium RIFOXYA1_FULL_40_18]OGM80771.1 MAG: hypothetical protein A2361_00965 [Candidatus Woesebacteria bacterium RIFOXYB1_FULL_40_26]